MKQFKIVVEKHPDTYVAYPLGIKGVVVGFVKLKDLIPIFFGWTHFSPIARIICST